MELSIIIGIIVGNIFTNNFILTRFLGLCPFFGVSKETRPALSMGFAVIFVMTMSSMITWAIYNFILLPFHIEFLRTIFFILVIAVFVQLVEMIVLKVSPALYKALGIYLPLITTNCAVMGVAVLNIDRFLKKGAQGLGGFLFSTTQGFCAGVGFTLAIVLMSGLRERLDLALIPESLKGLALAFIVASLMSMAFMGFSGFRFF